MRNPSIIHRFGTLPSKWNMSIPDLETALVSSYHPSDCLPYSSDNRQVKDQNRPIIDRPTITFQLLAAITAQVEGRVNLLMQKSLQELADALGMTTAQVTAQVAGEVKAPVMAPVTASVRRILELLSSRGDLGNAEILSAFELKNRRRMRETYLEPALRESLIEYTIPDKPTSSLQKYRLTEKGRAWRAGRKQIQ